MMNLIADVKANKYVAGVRQVNRHLMEGKIQKIYLAADCEEDFSKNVLACAQTCKVQVDVCGDRNQFAKACGIDVPCAVIGILKN